MLAILITKIIIRLINKTLYNKIFVNTNIFSLLTIAMLFSSLFLIKFLINFNILSIRILFINIRIFSFKTTIINIRSNLF